METQKWAVALRLKFLTATLVPVALGTAFAAYAGYQVNLLLAVFAFLSIGAVQIGANLSNDYFDHRSGNDGSNTSGSLFSGGSRAIQNGLLTPKQVIQLAYVFYAGGLLIGFAIAAILSDPIIAVLYILGTALAYFYCAPPVRFAYIGHAEVANFIGFGPLATAAAFRIQTPQFNLPLILASVLPGLLLALVLLINEFPDYEADKAAKKRTIVVRLGKKKAVKVFHSGLFMSYLYLFALVASGQLPIYSACVAVTIPITYRIILNSNANYGNTALLSKSNRDTILLHLLFGLILAGTLRL